MIPISGSPTEEPNTNKIEEKRRREQLLRKQEDYREVATKVAQHEAQVNAARLTDHVRLHRVLVLMVSRLLDYAATWERDKAFAYYGMLYRQQDYGQLWATINRDQTDAFDCPRLGFEVEHNETVKALKERGQPDGYIGLVAEKHGFLTEDLDSQLFLFDEQTQKQFKRAFVGLKESRQNPADIRAAQRASRQGKKTRSFPHRGANKWLNKKEIRNDLAHMDAMREKAGLNLTYLVNATRSLMAYDQKQKNAVVKSVKRILAEEGLGIDWRMNEDRLTRPVVYPLEEEHLKMVHWKDALPDPIRIPRASDRLRAMVQAIFDFGTSGRID